MRVAVPANVQRTIWSPNWSPTRDHGPALTGTDRHAVKFPITSQHCNRTEQNAPGSSASNYGFAGQPEAIGSERHCSEAAHFVNRLSRTAMQRCDERNPKRRGRGGCRRSPLRV